MSARHLSVLIFTITLLTSVSLAQLRGDEDESRSANDVAEELHRLAQPFQIEREVDGKLVPMQWYQPALMNFIDLAREQEHSRLWMWTAEGRPAAFLGVSMNAKRRAFEAASVSDERLVVSYGDAKWELKDTRPVWQALKSEVAPSANARLRLIQMKRLAERFVVRETQSKDGKHDLRLMPAPVYRAPTTDTPTDFAVLIFAYGTNAEVILCLESSDILDGVAWRYSFAAPTAAELNVTLDGAIVWVQPKYKFFGPNTRTMYVSKNLPDTRVGPPATLP